MSGLGSKLKIAATVVHAASAVAGSTLAGWALCLHNMMAFEVPESLCTDSLHIGSVAHSVQAWILEFVYWISLVVCTMCLFAANLSVLISTNQLKLRFIERCLWSTSVSTILCSIKLSVCIVHVPHTSQPVSCMDYRTMHAN